MHAYLQTFRRHRFRYLLPVLFGAAIAGWFALGAPKQYASDASLWVDTAPTSDVAPGQPGDGSGALVPPAAQAQMLLNELLTTREFRVRVGDESPLAAYLVRHGPTGWSPSALIASLRARPSLDDRLVAALGASGVTSKVVGPQLLAITLTAPDANVASATLRVLTGEFDRESQAARTRRGATAVAYYRDQVRGAEKTLLAAHAQVDQYLAAHPTLKPCSTPASTTALDTGAGCTDLRLRALTDADRAAAARLVDATGNLNQASINLASLPAAGAAFRIIDAPQPPLGPVAGKKKIIIAIVAGLFAGVIASLLMLAAVTALGRRPSFATYDDRAEASSAAATATAPTGPHTRRGSTPLPS
jgi:hypothetical protein